MEARERGSHTEERGSLIDKAPETDDGVTLYAWVGVDRTGTRGLMAVQTLLGVGPATFEKRKNAESVRDQVQIRANELGVEVKLIKLTEVEEVDTVTPRTRNN